VLGGILLDHARCPRRIADVAWPVPVRAFLSSTPTARRFNRYRPRDAFLKQRTAAEVSTLIHHLNTLHRANGRLSLGRTPAKLRNEGGR